MVEPVSAGLVAAALYSGRKTLGPTLDMIGTELREAVEPRVQNLASIIDRAEKRGGDAPAGESVHPRILNHLVHEGSWVDDAIHQEYVAGVLVSARSDVSDDEQLDTLALVTSLTSRQVGLHHATYWPLAVAARAQDWGHAAALQDHTIYGESDAVAALVGLDVEAASLVAESVSRKQLMSVNLFGVGDEALDYVPNSRGLKDPFIASPTLLGINVFLAAYGVRCRTTQDLNAIDWNSMPPIGPTVASFSIRPLS